MLSFFILSVYLSDLKEFQSTKASVFSTIIQRFNYKKERKPGALDVGLTVDLKFSFILKEPFNLWVVDECVSNYKKKIATVD